ncbi:MAG: hypothetical protein FJ271_12105 [Planctomycetes bacterium]|nr:hypothetical protein [Planctomycetota bacterium]
MKRLLVSMCAVLLTAGSACAHFVWIIPDGATAAKVVFSDELEPDDRVSIDKIAATKLMAIDAAGKPAPLDWTKGKHCLQVKLPKGVAAIGGGCAYGVIQRGESKPYLLAYHAKYLKGDLKTPSCGKLPLEIIIVEPGKVRVQFQGKPLAGAEVVAMGPGDSKAKATSDAQGEAKIAMSAGLHGIRAKHTEKKAGDHNGKKYDEIRHYATLVFVIAGKTSIAPEIEQTTSASDDAAPVIKSAKVSLLPPLPRAVSSFGAAAVDGQVYVYGGHAGKAHTYSTDSVIGTFQRLSLSNPKEWVSLPAGPARQGLALVAHGRKLYRIGGMYPKNNPDEKTSIHSVADCACFDPGVGKWQAAPDMPSARSSHDAVVVGDKIVVVGGWQLNGSKGSVWHDTALILDLSAAKPSWQAVKQPFKRRALTAAVHDGKVYVMGGLIGGDKKGNLKKAAATQDKAQDVAQKKEKSKVRQTGMGGMTLEVNIFDPKTVAWTKGPEIPGPMRNAFSPAACSTGGKLYLSTSDGYLYRLSAKGDAWETVGEIKQRRYVHRLVPNGAQRIVVLGGASQTGPVAVTEEVTLTSR